MPITNFLKNEHFHLHIYIMLNTDFVCEIFYFMPHIFLVI
jgi:hypothetical protein